MQTSSLIIALAYRHAGCSDKKRAEITSAYSFRNHYGAASSYTTWIAEQNLLGATINQIGKKNPQEYYNVKTKALWESIS